MKKILLAGIVGILTTATSAFAQYGGSLNQGAENLQAEARQLGRLVRQSNLPFQTVSRTEQLVRETESIRECVLGLNDNDFGRPGRPDRPGRPNRPGRPDFNDDCDREIQRAEQTVSILARELRLAGPRIQDQLQRTSRALQIVASQAGDNGPGGLKLIARGQMNRVPFTLQGRAQQNILNKCLRFADQNRIYRVYSLTVNGHPIDARNLGVEQACRIVARSAN
jgi:hypothetical protein